MERAAAHPALSYGLVAALQLRVVWGIWHDRDTTPGDTASYFLDAAGWAHGLHDNIVWSPLYTNFFGTVDALVGDVPNAVLVHRLLIVFGASLLVLAVMRSLFGPAVGLFVALWWTALPSNYNVEYEVHLFGMLPVLVALLVVSRSTSIRARGIALAVLVGSTLLVRNELIIATALFALLLIVAEVRSRSRTSGRLLLESYGIPLLVVAMLFGGAYWRSHIQGDQVRAALAAKQELNMCQVYAFTYQQRHPDLFTGSPWTDCGPLMQRTFGEPMPTFGRALRENTHAVTSFVAWNGHLLLSGLQVGLFGETGTGDDPGFFPVRKHRTAAWLGSAALLAVLAAGLVFGFRSRAFWRRRLRDQRWAIALLAGVALTTLVVALTERPRPEYLYGLTLTVMILFGYAVTAIVQAFAAWRAMAVLSAAVALVAIVVMSSHYHPGPRPLHDGLRHLQTVRARLRQPGSVLLTSQFSYELCSYLALDSVRHCSAPNWASVEPRLTSANLRSVLRRQRVTVIYADPRLRQDPAVTRLVSHPESFGWRQVTAGTDAGGPWSVLVRS